MGKGTTKDAGRHFGGKAGEGERDRRGEGRERKQVRTEARVGRDN